MDEYFCPNCGAILNDQYGFDPDAGAWECTECGKMLVDDDVYEGDMFPGVAWFCDSCGALLNRQSGFSDDCGCWDCQNCGHQNRISEDEIDDGRERHICPNCGAVLDDQWLYADYKDDWECAECGSHLHHSYSDDPYSIVEEAEEDSERHICPNCGADLNDQFLYDDNDEWKCTECGVWLKRIFSDDPYSVDEDDDDDTDGRYDYCAQPRPSTSRPSASRPSAPPPRREEYIQPISKSAIFRKRLKAFIFKGKRIRIGIDSRIALCSNYQKVADQLKCEGFSDIRCTPVYDIYEGSATAVDEVARITINGNPVFSAADEVPYNSKIVISYHKKRLIELPYSLKSFRRMDAMNVERDLRRLGFTEIIKVPIYDVVTGWIRKDGSIERVTLNGQTSVKKRTTFEYDVRFCIEYHAKKSKRRK